MDTEIDWRGEIDASFGTREDLDVMRFVASGRRAVRRRRLAATAVTASLVVAGSAAWAAGPGAEPRTEAPIATTGPAPEQTDVTQSERDKRLEDLRTTAEAKDVRSTVEFIGNPATFDDDGRLVLAPRTSKVLQKVHNPMGYTLVQGTSVGLRTIYDGTETYTLLAGSNDGGVSLVSTAATGDFTGWLAGVVQTQHTLDVANGLTGPMGTIPPDKWIRVAPNGQVESGSDEIVLVTVRHDLDLGEIFGVGADQTGVVRLRVGEQPQVVVYRVIDSRLEVIPGGDWVGSLSAFATMVRKQYASGKGLR